jgi:hypothetical protein
MVERATRLLAPSGQYSEKTETSNVDIGLLFLRLLLFEEYVIESRFLTEIPALLREIGYDQTCALLRSGCVRILCDSTGIGQIGQSDILLQHRPMGILPPGSFAFARVHQSPEIAIGRGEELISRSKLIGLRKVDKLVDLIHERMVEVPDSFGNAALEQLQTDLARNDPVIRSAVLLQLQKQNLPICDPASLEINFHQLSDFKDVRAELSISGRLLIDARSQHKAIERSLMAVADLEMRLQQMRDLNLVSGFMRGDLPVLDGRTALWASDLAPEAQESRWRRIIGITGLPNIRYDPGIRRINIERVIKLAKSRECQDFRQWLRGSDDLTAEEIRDNFSSVIHQASVLFRGGPGRSLMLLFTNFLPIPQPAPFVIGVLDNFLLDRFLPEPGPTAFISESYPSLFRQWLPPQREPEPYRNWFS